MHLRQSPHHVGHDAVRKPYLEDRGVASWAHSVPLVHRNWEEYAQRAWWRKCDQSTTCQTHPQGKEEKHTSAWCDIMMWIQPNVKGWAQLAARSRCHALTVGENIEDLQPLVSCMVFTELLHLVRMCFGMVPCGLGTRWQHIVFVLFRHGCTQWKGSWRNVTLTNAGTLEPSTALGQCFQCGELGCYTAKRRGQAHKRMIQTPQQSKTPHWNPNAKNLQQTLSPLSLTLARTLCWCCVLGICRLGGAGLPFRRGT